jgi:hypothetical protein
VPGLGSDLLQGLHLAGALSAARRGSRVDQAVPLGLVLTVIRSIAVGADVRVVNLRRVAVGSQRLRHRCAQPVPTPTRGHPISERGPIVHAAELVRIATQG